jgi:hypothetical protein
VSKESHHQGQRDKKPIRHEIERIESRYQQPYQPVFQYEPQEGGDEQREQVERNPAGGNY